MPLSTCDSCGGRCHSEARTCPWCGKPNPVRPMGALGSCLDIGCAFVVIGVIALVLMVMNANNK